MALHSTVTTTKEAELYSAVDVKYYPRQTVPPATVLKIKTEGTHTNLGMYHQIVGGAYANKYIESFDFRKETYLDE